MTLDDDRVFTFAAYDEARKIDTRSLYVIGPDGKIAYKTQPFRVLVAEAYTELGLVAPPITEEGASVSSERSLFSGEVGRRVFSSSGR